jgi:mRNA interferase RelE/StbE
MASQEQLHEAVERLAESQVDAALSFLHSLSAPPAWPSLAAAPLDDEPETDEVYRPAAVAGLRRLDPPTAHRLIAAVERYAGNDVGDVKRIRSARPEYRLRVGDWRIRFETGPPGIMRVLCVRHRSEAYR